MIAPELSFAMLKHNPPKPAREGCWIAQIVQRQIGIDKRLLRRIFGTVAIAQHRNTNPLRHALETPNDFRKRTGFAMLSSNHEFV